VLASLCARYLLIEPRESQAAFVIPDHIAHSDPLARFLHQMVVCAEAGYVRS
jgi:hypothetical protein